MTKTANYDNEFGKDLDVFDLFIVMTKHDKNGDRTTDSHAALVERLASQRCPTPGQT